MKMEKPRLGVALMQMGGPDSEEAIRPFLRNLFRDPYIISLPLGNILRGPLAHVVSSVRARRVKRFYRMIGGRSPLMEITRLQASSLEKSLSGDYTCRVVVAMRYWHPFTEEAVKELESFSPDRVVLIPLYPQYCSATTGSCLNRWEEVAGRRFACERRVVSFHDHPSYIEALAGRVRDELAAAPSSVREGIHVLFSAHGLPSYLDRRGDPYRSQVEETVEELAGVLGLEESHSLAFQSRLGPVKWIGPFIEDEIRRLAGEGREALLVVPVSFVSDHLETLYELGIRMKEVALRSNIKYYRVSGALNDSPDFIATLKALVLRSLEEER